MKNFIDRNEQEKSQYQQYIYNHFLQLIDIESSEEIIKRFRILFINCSEYPDRKVSRALEIIIALLEDKEEFNFFLNRCFLEFRPRNPCLCSRHARSRRIFVGTLKTFGKKSP